MKQRTRKVGPNTVEVALGDALEWGIHRWVVWTGRETRISEAPWLEGPIGERRIGPSFSEAYAREEALELVEGEPETGLLSPGREGRFVKVVFPLPNPFASSSIAHSFVGTT